MSNHKPSNLDIEILRNYKISSRLSMGIGGKVSHFYEVYNEQRIPELYSFSLKNELPFYVLGGGSNLVINDENHKCLMIAISMKGIDLISSDSKFVQIRVAAGENWDEFVQYCIKNKYWGCENLSLIPGLVGAAPVQNIGAFGQEVKNIIHSVRCYDLQEECFVDIMNSECDFKFRSSIFNSNCKGRYVICSVVFNLSKTPIPCLKRGEFIELRSIDKNTVGLQLQIRDVVVSYRTNGKNLPVGSEYGSSGTFFRTGIINSKIDFIKIIFKTLFCLGPLAALAIAMFSVKYRSSEGFRIPSKLLIQICGLSNLKYGGFFLLPTNPACVVSRYDQRPLSIDLVRIIDTVVSKVYTKTGVVVPIEPEMLGFSHVNKEYIEKILELNQSPHNNVKEK